MDDIVLCLENIQQIYSKGSNSVKIILLVKGKLDVFIDEQFSQLKPEDILIINKNQSHTILGDSKNIVLFLELKEDYLKRECSELSECRFVCNSSSVGASASDASETDRTALYFELKRRLMRILIVSMNRNPGFRMEVKSHLFSLFSYLYKYFCVDNEYPRHKDDKESAIQDIVAFLKENYWQDLSLDMIAKRAYMSPTYFSRYFKIATGVGFLNYLMDIRLDHAMADLLDTDESILKISIRHGFASAKALSTAFRNKYGVLPSDYRIERKNREQTLKHEDIVTRFDISLMSSNFEFLQHFLQNQEDTANATNEETTIALNATAGQFVAWPAKIIMIESTSSLQQAETVSQLRYVQERLGFQYIYICDNDEAMTLWLREWATFGFYELSSILSLLNEIGLIPIIRVNYSYIKKIFACKGGTGEFLKLFRKVLERLSGSVHLKNFIRQCKFEFYCSADEEYDESVTFYTQVVRGLPGFLGQNSFGILAFTDMSNRSRERLSQTLTYLASQEIVPVS